MADVCVQLVARFPSVSGQVEDRTENVIHLLGDSATYAADLAEAVSLFRDFWTVDTGAGQARPVAEYLAGAASRASNAASILAYVTSDLSGATPFGPAEHTLNFTLPAPAVAQSMPNEVAVVLSSHADLSGIPISEVNPSPPPATIRPAQRRKGRMFIGPLCISAGQGSSGIVSVSNTFATDLGLAAGRLQLNLITDTALEWAIWSRADAALYPVIGGYVDGAWDTQRRRGIASSTRTTWSPG